MPTRGLRSIENPSTEILNKYFGEYSIASKSYQTHDDEDPLFQEVARVLLEYGFLHPRPPAMPKCRDGFVIAVFEGLQVDWSAIVVDSLRSAIASIVDRKKAWCGLAQWLTLLEPPIHAIKPKKQA